MLRTRVFSFLCSALIVALGAGVTPAAASGEFVDRGTGRNAMHSCPVGTFLVGIHVAGNLFLCSSDFGGYQAADEMVDSHTSWQGMHACPDGMAMTGFHQAANLLACAPVSRENRQSDATTRRSGMHACPTGAPMSGIDVSNDKLLCGSDGETEDSGTQRNGMHSCPVGRYVSGISVDRDVLMCAVERFGGLWGYTPAQEFVDRGTAMQSMHACPVNTALTGVHIGQNLLACAPGAHSRRIVSAWSDAFRAEMGTAHYPWGDWLGEQYHACPEWSPVSGLHVGRNLLLCGTDALSTSGEFLDTATWRNGIRSCPGSTFMIGEHQDRDLLLCSSAFANQGGEFLDRSTVVFGNTHGCLAGFAMTGANIVGNVFSCARTSGVPTQMVSQDYLDRQHMLSCDFGMPMSGLNAGLNWAPCGVR